MAIILNEKLNDIAQKMLWSEAVHMCKRVRNNMATTSSTNIPFEIFYGEQPKIVGFFSEFRRIAYLIKRGQIKR